jgi:RNA polymerase sigma-70 factor (ECF subfamily)
MPTKQNAEGCEPQDPERRTRDGLVALPRRRGRDNGIVAAYQEHGALLRRLCRRALGSKEDGEDAAQDVIVRLLESNSALAGGAISAAQLTIMAKNRCRDMLRRREVGRRAVEREQWSALDRSSSEDPQDVSERRDLCACVLKRITADAQKMLCLHAVDGRTLDEIAALTGRGRRTVQRVLERAFTTFQHLRSKGRAAK